jgi:hypothetical protein
MIPRRILVPVTLAPGTADVAAEVAALAAAVHAELLLLGVAPRVARGEETGEQQALERVVARRLEELAGALPAGLDARVLLTRDAVAPALVAAARERRADLVVFPVRRERDPGHLAVLRQTDAPLLLVKVAEPRG